MEDWRSTSIEKRKNSPFISLLISTYFIAFLSLVWVSGLFITTLSKYKYLQRFTQNYSDSLMNVFKNLLTSISDWQNSALFVFRFMLVPLNDQPTRRETRKRERHRRKKKSFTLFSHGRAVNRFHGMPKHLFNLSIRTHIKLPRRPPA